MRFWSVCLAIGLGAAILLFGCLSLHQAGADKKVEIVADHLEIPWAIDSLPNGDLIFTERPGRIRLIHEGVLDPKPIANLSVATVGESGLLGLAVDPEFSSHHFIYVYYTYFKGTKMLNRVSRFTLENNTLSGEKILVDEIPGGLGDQGYHNGGRIKFGPDGKLYITTGDGGVPGNAQNLSSLGGKILRINKDGSVPSDNPFNSSVYSYGHRNPQGLAWNKVNGTWVLYSTEHGPIGNDELNVILPGKNYQWPDHQCNEKVDPALICFTETIAPSGAAFYNDSLYIAALRGTQIRKIDFDGNISQEVFLMGYGRMRDIYIKDGYLYALTSDRDGRWFFGWVLPKENDDLILRIKLE